jgi:hemerythrin
MLMEWSDEYLIGIEQIDQQHKNFFAAAHRLHDAIMMSEGEQAVEEAMQFLRNYAREHFEAEEAFMQQHAFPGIEEHKKIHARFLNDFDTFVEEYNTHKTPSQELADDVLEIAQDWLIDHIADIDTVYAKHVKSRS